MVTKTTTEQWLTKARQIHGDKYEYPVTEWGSFNNRTSLPIICPLHGVFYQSLSNHTHNKKPTGCPTCSGKKKLTVEERIKQAVSVHGDKYDYSKWPDHLNAKTKVVTLCKSCNNEWLHNIDNHVRGRGCPNCKTYIAVVKHNERKIKNSEINTRKCVSLIKNKGRENYNYESLKVPFKTKSVYEFECKKHGRFLTTPYNHFVKNSECPNCTNEKIKALHMFGFEKWLSVLKQIHTEYTFREHEHGSNTAKDKIYVTCPEHGEWLTSIDSLKTSGCPACKGQSQRYLYVNLIEDGSIKFGIASDLDRRLSGQNRVNKLKMERLMYFVFENYSDCRNCESEIKSLTKPTLSKSDLVDGWTETCSLSNLDLITSICKSFKGKLNG